MVRAEILRQPSALKLLADWCWLLALLHERIRYVHTCGSNFRLRMDAASCGRLNPKQIETGRTRATEFAQLPPSLPPSLFPRFSFPPSLIFFRSLPTFSRAAVDGPAFTGLELVPGFPYCHLSFMLALNVAVAHVVITGQCCLQTEAYLI